MNVATSFRRASDGFATRAENIADSQWTAATPCTEWDVRALVNHVTGEYLWVPELLAGKTIAEVGNRFDGDVLGDDPLRAVRDAHRSAAAAADACDMDATVHLSFGDVRASEYVMQMTIDSTIHAWDLARGIGADDTLDPEVVEIVYAEFAKQAEAWRAGGSLGPAKTPVDDSTQAKLIALSGR